MRRKIRTQTTRALGRKRRATIVAVYPEPGQPQRGQVCCGPLRFPCALGRSGVTYLKREGDGATPAARMQLRSVRVRPDHIRGVPWVGPCARIMPADGWCDDPGHGRYNTAVRLPFRASHERMWREDHLYDLVGVLDWNLRPRIRRRGSAIFLHLAREGFRPTEGCIAIRRGDLLRLLGAVGPRIAFSVAPAPRKVAKP